MSYLKLASVGFGVGSALIMYDVVGLKGAGFVLFAWSWAMIVMHFQGAQ